MKKVLVMIAVLLLVVAMPVCAFAGPYDNEFNEDEIKTCFIEPDYYPDYDVAPAPMPAPEKAPKTNAGSLLPQFALAAVAVGSIAVALKRTK